MKRKDGFTLIEMLFVMGIIVVLMLLVIPNVTSKTAMVKNQGCKALISVVDGQIQLFEINEGYLPRSINDLVSKGYINKEQARCPNGKDISIANGQAYAN